MSAPQNRLGVVCAELCIPSSWTEAILNIAIALLHPVRNNSLGFKRCYYFLMFRTSPHIEPRNLVLGWP